MFSSITNSFNITKKVLKVISKEKKLLFYPLIGGFFSVIFFILMVFPALFGELIPKELVALYDVYSIFLIFGLYFGIAFITIFFNTCVVYTTKKIVEGKKVDFFEPISFSLTKLKPIIGWALISATVGLILRLLDQMAERLGNTGEMIVKIITSILGGLWSFFTVLVIPSYVFEDVGPIDAIKKSFSLVKKTWGENIVRNFGFSAIQFLLILIGVVFGYVLINILPETLIGIILIITAIYILSVLLFFSVANNIYNTVLYMYAKDGKTVDDFETVSESFTRIE